MAYILRARKGSFTYTLTHDGFVADMHLERLKPQRLDLDQANEVQHRFERRAEHDQVWVEKAR